MTGIGNAFLILGAFSSLALALICALEGNYIGFASTMTLALWLTLSMEGA